MVFLFVPADDDPEGQEGGSTYKRIMNAASGSYESDIHFLLGNNPLDVNAFQRYSNVVVQTSTREGFGLTVTEALWKETPVVATDVGGIPLQVLDGKTGYLVPPGDYVALSDSMNKLLSYPDEAREMGKAGREHVRRNFLTPRHLGDELRLLNSLYRN